MASASPTRRRTLPGRISPAVVRRTISGLLFISPWLVGLCVFTLYPVLASLYYSFTNYDIISTPTFTGLDNYQTLLTKDPLFWKAVGNTFFYATLAVPLNLLVGLGVALLLNAKVRGLAFFRTVFFLPSIVPDIASAMLWSWMLNPQFGLVNAMLKLLGIPTIGWLSDPAWSKPALLLIGLWGFGGSMIILLAALQDVPQHLYESAEIDGANSWQKTWNVTLPMITPTIFFNLVIGIIGAFQYFTSAFVLSGGSGGPAGSTLMYAMMIYQNAFKYFKMGYASAMAWLLFTFVLALTLVLFKTSGRWIYYEGEKT